ncbi:glycerol-3-phosphate O-acyltransferase [Yamadazyma tenuis]|uniref:Phospholipid/glycerol acyltransferase domain-containing protein n=1 Tax=Candida tenuis (strain ATCC 10573 / BCRC 21748 / CBS 615 / JCM 9827 / NBRC 10315 / NRRL Y-1498 / VKM Y-70) TaxID=590646 RepID=G3BDP1_CANTC|nr:uncharacterized protein CANTEDRAFT_111583 [Yamadazyma tenuis ATCC 10573]EGV60348.1 hypothetical protein CANTEDRAFT_111583 [Yamadazyma tenuis ATCC 10573]WEJ94411.1 glycerol-3-phosphate O-acyltransferase [Yamadazyma tenuis]
MSIGNQLYLIVHAIVYDLVVVFCQSIIHTFFKDIRVRGSFNIPKKGPIIFVIAPHHNQFLDGSVVAAKIKEYGDRRVSFLVAGKSYRDPFIGLLSRLTSAIPVERAQDLMKTAKGKIYLGDQDNIIIGEGTKFTKDCQVKGLIGLPNSKGNFQIVKIVSDTEVEIKGDYKDKRESLTKIRYDMLRAGSRYKTAPHVDNHVLFQKVFDFLNSGKAMGLFPEGGSHDRSDLLPLKPGVAIMALGAISQCKDPDGVINIIPMGLNYFHAHRFRSRAVIEFGKPLQITKEDGEKYLKDQRKTINDLLNTITFKLKEVTVTCDDFETLVTLQAVRRLFTTGQREQIPLPMVVEMNRRLIRGYELHKDEPDVIEMKKLVMEYNKQLMLLGLHDHQVDSLTASNKLHTAIVFLGRLFKVFLFFGLSMPGIFLFSPVFITAIRISKKKQKEALAGSVVKIEAKDVLGTWKVLVALVLAPSLYVFYSICGTVLILKLDVIPWLNSSWKYKALVFLFCYFWSVLTTYASLRIGEIGVDYYKSLKPLFYSLVSENKDLIQIDELKNQRQFLSQKVTDFCDRYGRVIFKDYQEFYDLYNENDIDVNIANVKIFSDQVSEHSSSGDEEEKETHRNEEIRNEATRNKISKMMKKKSKQS